MNVCVNLFSPGFSPGVSRTINRLTVHPNRQVQGERLKLVNKDKPDKITMTGRFVFTSYGWMVMIEFR